MTEDLTGRVVAVATLPLGSVLVQDAPAGSPSLFVDDAADFDGGGGYLLMNGHVLVYVSVDDETGEVRLDENLEEAAAALADDRVEVWDLDLGARVVETVAQVLVEGTEQGGDPLDAIVDQSLIPFLPEGIRDDADQFNLTGESVTLSWRGDDLYVVNIIGREAQFDGAVILPGSIPDLVTAQADLDNLNDVVIPDLQTGLGTAQSDIDAAQADIATLDGKFPVGSTDIQDGAISTPKMTANSINGDRITANTLDAAKIVAGSITTDRMTANSINGDRITTNTLNADRIVANSITGDRIAANAITAGLIAAGAVTAAKLESALVLSTRIIAGASTGARVEINSSGMSAYNSTGTQTIAFDAATGNATIMGAFGTSAPTAAGVHISSSTFSGIYGQATYPTVEFHNGNTTTGFRQPKIFTDTTGAANLYVWSGAASGTRMGMMKLDGPRARLGVEGTAGGAELDGTVIDLQPNTVSVNTGVVYQSSTWKAKMSFDSVATFTGYEANNGDVRGFQILAGDGSARILCSALSVLAPNGASFNPLTAEKIVSTANGIFMSDLNGGGVTGASIGNGGRITRTTSSIRYKENVAPLPIEEARKVLDLDPVTYTRKDEADAPAPFVYPGFIAEQADEVGASLWVNYDTEGRPDGIRYAELTAALLPLVKDLSERVAALETP